MINVGDRLPEATLMAVTDGGPEPVKTTEVFAGKRVALFAVPGAFTPTCSAKHLPGFVEQKDALMAKGVDLIACVAVNDVYVMSAWAKQQNVGDAVMLLADGNGEFTRALGLEWDLTNAGLGQRSQRFSMVLKDNVVEQLYVEQPGAFEVSSADYMLGKLG